MTSPVLPAELEALLAIEAWPAGLDAAVAAAEGWTDAEDVRLACRRNRVRDLLGGDERAQRDLARALESVATQRSARSLAAARRAAARVLDHLQLDPHAVRLAVTGGLRRMAPRIERVELLATSDEPTALGNALREARFVASSRIEGDTVHARLVDGTAVTLRVLPEDAARFVVAHVESTGPAAFVDGLRERARLQGLAWNAALGGLPTHVPLETEADLFAALDLAPVPPERRAAVARGEPIGLLVEAADVRGLAALHAAHGAGRFPLVTLADTAAAQGFAWLLVADHVRGADPRAGREMLAAQREEAMAWRRRRSDVDDEQDAPALPDVLLGARIPLEHVTALPEADLVIGVPTASDWPAAACDALATGQLDVLAPPPRTAAGADDLRAWGAVIDAARDAGAAVAFGGEGTSAAPPFGVGALLVQASVPVLLDADETMPGELDQLLAALGQARREAVPAPLVLNAWSAARLRTWVATRRERTT